MATAGATLGLALGGVVLLQHELELRRSDTRVEGLRFLPPGEYLKPVLLGYHHIAADITWLRVVQTLGKTTNTGEEYEWLYHAMDVITTLDPHYIEAYQVGGVVLTELGHRVELSNKLLSKGLESNPTAWKIPFYLAYNYFFHLQKYAEAAEYMSKAAAFPDSPALVSFLASRLYAEAGDPETGLNFLTEMWRQAEDPQIKESLEGRMKELMIERDIRLLEAAVERYREIQGERPRKLSDLVEREILTAIPQEPFGGKYRLDPQTGGISSTHPERLRIYRPGGARGTQQESSR